MRRGQRTGKLPASFKLAGRARRKTMKATEQLADSLASSVQLAGEGIVRVEGRRRLPSSGLLWAGGDLVVTAHHTIERRSDVTVGLTGGEAVGAQGLGRDPANALAVARLAT